MTRKYYISDLHIFHKNCIEFDNRPFASLEEMHEKIRGNWNARITNGDIVYLLGDISFRGKNDDLIAFVSTLKGLKVLIKGNHDDVSDYRYAKLFEEILDYKEIKDTAFGRSHNVILSHYPIFSWRGMNHGNILLYGHTHMSAEDTFYQECLSKMPTGVHNKPDEILTAINVGCMQPYMDYTPRTLEELIKTRTISEQ